MVDQDSSKRSNTSSEIKPAAFSAPGQSSANNAGRASPTASPSSAPALAWWQSQFNLMLSAFALLAIAAGLLILLAPPPSLPNSSGLVIENDGPDAALSPAASQPWDESRRAQARSDAQEVLADLLVIKKQLETKDVAQWGSERYVTALQLAEQGDQLYGQQQYAAAIDAYKSSLQSLESMLQQIPKVVESRVADGRQAIKDGKAALAQQLFKQALQLDQNNIPALQGIDRANNLDKNLQQIAAAQSNEHAYQNDPDDVHLRTALQQYKEVLADDPQLQQAVQGVQRVEAQLDQHRYREFMSQGFNALFSGRGNSAKTAFAKALEIKPQDPVARSVYRQALASDGRASIASVIASAQRFESQESWVNALTNYQAALQRDPNQVSAKLGVIRSQARGELDQRLKTILQNPVELSLSRNEAAARNALSDAKAIANKGPLLKAQIAQLQSLLAQLDRTIEVTLQSDQLTAVSVTKTGARSIELGRFERKDLALKPGSYVLTGTRLGFKDVRREITISPGAREQRSIRIVCDEAVALGAVSGAH